MEKKLEGVKYRGANRDWYGVSKASQIYPVKKSDSKTVGFKLTREQACDLIASLAQAIRHNDVIDITGFKRELSVRVSGPTKN